MSLNEKIILKSVLHNKRITTYQQYQSNKAVINHCEYVKIINIDMVLKNGPIQPRFISTG